MTAGWVLPRDWDASRLLRFLSGLALLVLAFTANAGLIATPVTPAPAAPAAATTIVDVPAARVAQAPAAEAAETPAPAAQPVVTVAVLAIGEPVLEPTLTADPAGVVPGSYGSRAPPAV